ncbi:MAG: retropepsin-like aspartic protease family protein [Steroidobacteraceae bacterium]
MRLHRQNGAILTSAALLGLCLLGASASAAPDSVVAAVKANNVTALAALSKSGPTAQQRSLAAGALLALHHEDAEAIAMLLPVTRSTASRIVRATAYLALSDVYIRDQRYHARYSAIRAASKLSPKSVDLGYQQSMAFAHELTGVKPMRVVRETPGSLPITDEKGGMIRVPVRIDGHRLGAMVDTGANMSAISASVAKRVGIQTLGQSASVGSATERTVAVRLGIARRLQIGNAIFENVVFIVLPDSELSLPPSYRISAFIGLPVLMALGRLEFVNSGSPRLLYDISRGKTANEARARPNMLLSGLEPLLLVRVPGAGNPLRMKLDTGSDRTYFTRNATQDAPALFAHAEQYVWHVGSAGGVVTERRARRLPEAPFIIGERRIVLKNVIVNSRASSTSDGVIGEDLLSQDARWTIDFKSMTLAVAK